MGEFIFDAEWAQYATKLGIQYYPKLLCGIPFTPVTCPKIIMTQGFEYYLRMLSSESSLSSMEGMMTKDDSGEKRIDVIQDFRRLVVKFIKDLATSNNISSVHINFIPEDEACDIAGPLIYSKSTTTSSGDEEEDGKENYSSKEQQSPIKERVKSVIMNKFIPNQKKKDHIYFRRVSLQYHWQNRNTNNHNQPYQSFDDYLSCFKSKKRINIKRERKKVYIDQNIRIDAIVGKDILKYPGLVRRMFELYKSTVDKQLFFGRQYLNLDFFQQLVESDYIDNLLFMCARFNNGNEMEANNEDDFDAKDVFAGTFNIVKDKVFYGRYWGCLPEYDVKNVHFEVCYWSAIEYCIENDFVRMEPGAGGGGKLV